MYRLRTFLVDLYILVESGAYSGFRNGRWARFNIYTYIARSAFDTARSVVPFLCEAGNFFARPPKDYHLREDTYKKSGQNHYEKKKLYDLKKITKPHEK